MKNLMTRPRLLLRARKTRNRRRRRKKTPKRLRKARRMRKNQAKVRRERNMKMVVGLRFRARRLAVLRKKQVSLSTCFWKLNSVLKLQRAWQWFATFLQTRCGAFQVLELFFPFLSSPMTSQSNQLHAFRWMIGCANSTARPAANGHNIQIRLHVEFEALCLFICLTIVWGFMFTVLGGLWNSL